MNATMINNREFVETQHAMESVINQELVNYANKFYIEKLSDRQEKELLSMSLEDKLWLLDQYKSEVSYNREPDFSNIY